MTKHIRVANCRFRNFELPHCHQVVQVAFRTEMASVLGSAVCVIRVEARLVFCASSMSANSLLYHDGKRGIRLYGVDEASPGVFVL